MSYEVDDFNIDVIQKSHDLPVLVDFWAEWCGPCKVLGPVIEGLADRHANEWKLVKVDTEKHREIAAQYGIQGIPNVKLFVDGEVKDEFTGALPEHMILEWLKKALPSKFDDQLREASEHLKSGKIPEAQELLNRILTGEPENEKAAVLLAQTLLHNDPDQATSILKAIEPGSELYDIAEGIRTMAGLFRHLVNADELPEDAVKESYLSSIDHLRNTDYVEALEGFIKVIERNRSYDDEGARRACIAIFKTLGESNDLTRKYRRPFSNALYS